MARDIVRDPATGKPAVATLNYEVIELEQLREAKDTAEAHHEAASVLAAAGYDGAQTILGEAETRLQDAKSEFEAGEGITRELDAEAGSEAASGEVADGAPVEEDASTFPQVA